MLEDFVQDGPEVGNSSRPEEEVVNMPDNAVDFEDENAQDGEKAFEYSRTLVTFSTLFSCQDLSKRFPCQSILTFF